MHTLVFRFPLYLASYGRKYISLTACLSRESGHVTLLNDGHQNPSAGYTNNAVYVPEHAYGLFGSVM